MPSSCEDTLTSFKYVSCVQAKQCQYWSAHLLPQRRAFPDLQKCLNAQCCTCRHGNGDGRNKHDTSGGKCHRHSLEMLEYL